MEKKVTKITREREQTRTTIPKKFVDEFEITKKDKIEWSNKSGKLKGKLQKEDTDSRRKANNG